MLLFTQSIQQRIVYFLVFCLMGIPFLADAQPLLEEGFEQGIPNTFTLVDNDGLTPNNPAFTAAWIATVDGGFNVVASTSWYVPAGSADDWLITPPLTIPATGIYTLSWLAYALEEAPFDDGYEVRVSTTNTNLSSFNDVLFSTLAENASPTTRTAPLTDYAGETIYIGFRNNSNDKNVLFLDDLLVEEQADFDGALVDVGRLNSEYSLLPVKQASPFSLSVDVANLGGQALTNVSVSGTIINEAGATLFTDEMGGALATLAAGDTVTFSGQGSFTPPDTGFYIGVFTLSSAEADQVGLNDTIATSLLVTDTVYARDIPTSEGLGLIGVGTDEDGKVLGSIFEVLVEDAISSTTILLLPRGRNLGDQPFVSVYTVNAQTGVPTSNVVANSFPYIITPADTLRSFNGFLTPVDFVFAGGPITLPPGKYLFGMHEGDSILSIGETADIYTPRSSFVTGDNGMLWQSVEEGYNGLENALVIRPNLNACANFKVSATTSPDGGTGDGSATLTVEGGTAPITYSWSSGQSTATVDGLATGTYTVTVSDGSGCSSVIEVVIGTTTSVEELLEAGIQELALYPVPATNSLTLDMEFSQPTAVQLRMLDLQGRVLRQLSTTKQSTRSQQFSIRDLSSGIYFLQVQTPTGSIMLKWMKVE
ncbi:MAG: choice-of-anchor J domain-containing protein [Bacteroidota bacterium]